MCVCVSVWYEWSDWLIDSVFDWMVKHVESDISGGGSCCNMGYPSPKHILNSNPAKSRLSITDCWVVKSFWKFSPRTAVSLPCSMQTFKTIWQQLGVLWTDEISRAFSLKCVSDVYFVLQDAHDNMTLLHKTYNSLTTFTCHLINICQVNLLKWQYIRMRDDLHSL